MQLTVNDHTRLHPVPVNTSNGGVSDSCNLAISVLRCQPEMHSHVQFTCCEGDEHVHWPSLLWQLALLKNSRPDLRLVLMSQITSRPWLCLLTALGISPGDALNSGRTDVPVIRRLSLTESRVLLTLLDGTHVQQIAERMHRDIRTVSSHKRHAMAKVGLANNGELYKLGAILYGQRSVSPPRLLSYTEQRVLASLFNHGSITDAARALNRSIKTVSGQKYAIMKKLGVTHEVALYALCNNWLHRN